MQFSKRLNDTTKPARQHFAALDSFLKEVQGEQTRLANELGARLDSADIRDLPVQNIPDLANMSSNQLEKLKAFLNKALNNRIPDSIRKNIESLQELDGMEKLLTRIVDGLNDDRPGGVFGSKQAFDCLADQQGTCPGALEQVQCRPGQSSRNGNQ